MRRVSFHIISMECLKMWFIERTQRGSVDIQEGLQCTAYPSRMATFKWVSLRKNKVSQSNFWKETYIFSSSFKVFRYLLWGLCLFLPQVEDDLEEIFQVNDQGLCLEGDRNTCCTSVLVVLCTFTKRMSMLEFAYLFICNCYLLCSLYGKKLMLPFWSTHISKCPVICDISGDEGDPVYHVLMFNHLMRTKALLATQSNTPCDVTVKEGDLLPISHRWSWCPTWKCWSRSSVCVCLETEQLLPYPSIK